MMSMQEFEGRTAAEAAIKACEVFGISRSQLDYKVLKDEGEGMDRRVVIEAEPAKNAAAAASSVAVSRDRPDEGRPPRRGRGNRGAVSMTISVLPACAVCRIPWDTTTEHLPIAVLFPGLEGHPVGDLCEGCARNVADVGWEALGLGEPTS